MKRIDTTQLDADFDDVLRRQSSLESLLSNQLDQAVKNLRAEMKAMNRLGPYDFATFDGGQSINFDGNDPDVANGVATIATNNGIIGSQIRNYRGTGASLSWPPGTTNPTAKYISNIIEFCHAGIAVNGDSEVSGNTIRAIRDYGLWNPRGAGNVSVIGNHFYGCNGCAPQGDYDGICIYMGAATGWRLVGNTMADSHYGLVASGGSSHTTSVSACTTFKNSKCGIWLKPGATNFRVQGTFNVPAATDHPQFNNIKGVELNGNRNSVHDSVISLDGVQCSGLPGTPNSGRSTGLTVSGHANNCVNTLFLDYGCPAGKARGIHIKSGVRGFRADVQLWGFEDPGDVLIDVESTDISGVHIVVRGNSVDSPGFNPSNIKQYLNIPAGWDGSKNSFSFFDEATNRSDSAIGGRAY